eukprot:COSAG01_NODE_246_length_20450_cov_195.166822_29_plen_219_part_00
MCPRACWQVAAEARSTGVDVAFSPVLNQWVDSRFGRLQEGFSENPTLTAAYAAAAANGFQGPQPAGKWAPMADDKVVALGKHYAAVSQPPHPSTRSHAASLPTPHPLHSPPVVFLVGARLTRARTQYGAALGGLNGAPAELSERTLREFYLHSWRAFAKAGGTHARTHPRTRARIPPRGAETAARPCRQRRHDSTQQRVGTAVPRPPVVRIFRVSQTE